MELNVILDLGIILSVLFISAYVVRRLRAPSILIYIILGLSLGAFVNRRSEGILNIFSEVGLILLFFFLGLEFSIERILSVARRIWAAGVIDLIINFGLGFSTGYFLHFNVMACIFLGAITYASSSAIILKLLVDLKRSANVGTEIILGILISEDIAASILLAILSGVGGKRERKSRNLYVSVYPRQDRFSFRSIASDSKYFCIKSKEYN